MARRTHVVHDDLFNQIEARIRLDGGLADEDAVSARQLGIMLQGYDRFYQQAYYSYQVQSLELPKPDTAFRTEVRIRSIGPGGSIIVDVVIWIGGRAVGGVIGSTAFEAAKGAWRWSAELLQQMIASRQSQGTLDDAVDELEAMARRRGIRASKDREDTESFVTELKRSLAETTAPLDSEAASMVLSLKGEPVDITVDQEGRQAIKMPFAPPTIDPDAEPVTEALVRFIRINKQTGWGIMEFAKPSNKSEFAHQRFVSQDRSIRRRGNPYTLAFHEDRPLMVRMQRKAYDPNRKGHYWLIVGVADQEGEPTSLFDTKPKRPRRRR